VIAIRPASFGEAGEIARLFRHVRSVCLPYLPRLHDAEEDLWFFRERVFSQCSVWVTGDGAIDGFCAFRTGWVDHLYVDPARHATGRGTALLGAAQAGQKRLLLWVFQKNVPATRFYEARGFRLLEQTDGSGNEEREPDALYEWRAG
jgi:putative acetyltransferase